MSIKKIVIAAAAAYAGFVGYDRWQDHKTLQDYQENVKMLSDAQRDGKLVNEKVHIIDAERTKKKFSNAVYTLKTNIGDITTDYDTYQRAWLLKTDGNEKNDSLLIVALKDEKGKMHTTSFPEVPTKKDQSILPQFTH